MQSSATFERHYILKHLHDYFPYGKTLREWYASNEDTERFQTTHHQRDTETMLDYRGARFYDADVGRFLSLDPLAADFPSWSDYNYVLGNPVIFVDPDGNTPLVFFFRSFHSSRTFGMPFQALGDNRTHSTNINASARVHHQIGYETSDNSITGVKTFSSLSTQIYYPIYPILNPKRGIENPLSSTWATGGGLGFTYSGQEPIMKQLPVVGGITPAIDVEGGLQISESSFLCLGCSEGETGLTQISITGQILGDYFPDAEAFVMDATGQTIMLGESVHSSPGGPAINLPGYKTLLMMTINLHIIVDKNGSFMSAYTVDSNGKKQEVSINPSQEGYEEVLNDLNIEE